MGGNDRGSVWLVIGVVAAITLGVVLIPLRTTVTASNLAFIFIALTIVIAEMGGRGPGLATAVISALSLNFFLTEPYLSLEIDKPGDIAAFVALTACGLIAAAFGKRRVRTAEQVEEARGDLEVLARTASSLSAREPVEQILEELRRFFGLGGLVLRRADERLVAAAPSSQASSARSAHRARPRDLGRLGHPRAPAGAGGVPHPRARRPAPAAGTRDAGARSLGGESRGPQSRSAPGARRRRPHDRARRADLPEVALLSSRIGAVRGTRSAAPRHGPGDLILAASAGPFFTDS